MKTFHVVKENYPVIFKYTKPDEYFDGFLEKHTWYFSVCDWMGNEIEGFDDENAMLEYWEQLTDEELEDIQIFAYPLVDDDEVDQGGYYNWYGQWIPHSTKKENYVFPNS